MNSDATITVIVTTIVTLVVNFIYKVFAGGKVSGSVAQRLTSIEDAIIGMQSEVKKMTTILVDIATVRGDVRLVEQRTERLEQDMRDLRRGRGFIQEDIKGEYPR